MVRAQDLPGVDAALRVDVVVARCSRTAPTALAHGLAGPARRRPSRTTWTCSGSRRVTDGVRRCTTGALDGFYVLTRAGWRDVR